MLRHQIPAAIVLSALLGLAATVGVMAKGDAIVTLDASVPGDPEPGTEITVGWTVGTPLENGGMAPFNAVWMFIRLIPTTGDPVEAVGRQGPLGHYAATLTVPAGGIRDVEVGLGGESCSGGTCQRSDMLFTIDESAVPATGPAAPANVPGAGAPQQATVDATSPAGAQGDLRLFGIVGLALVTAAVVVGVFVARGRGRARARPLTAGSSRS